ncbi:terminase small subunit [Globicatella sp. PHS-GS-PNBC-21-1553]|uniref:terminase small subunit n=1 Tax=Globicatella sp. PHS-GS-PNBC-21-1553 TaxID=2885764 RepID=UPI00298F090B|nr:terminase small subunit [Globicatella sp. PHS-GS-PNBC-21-1553]WPC07999.1 terminase small subunit [Globicatella sp. PHS-GS-PNBC-21-1553]
MVKLTAKQEKFVQGLISGLSQRQAYIEAGYATKGKSNTTIDANASRLFKNSKVLTRYDELMEEHKQKALWTREESIQNLKWLVDKARDSIERHDKGYVRQGTANALIGALQELNKLEKIYPLDQLHAKKLEKEIEPNDDTQNQVANLRKMIMKRVQE